MQVTKCARVLKLNAISSCPQKNTRVREVGRGRCRSQPVIRLRAVCSSFSAWVTSLFTGIVVGFVPYSRSRTSQGMG